MKKGDGSMTVIHEEVSNLVAAQLKPGERGKRGDWSAEEIDIDRVDDIKSILQQGQRNTMPCVCYMGYPMLCMWY